jgi:hypothetical protein
MSGYPYSAREHYPTDAKRIAYPLQWNTRFESGAPSSDYQFNYVPTTSAPGAPSRSKP